jgi:hypothetical protein
VQKEIEAESTTAAEKRALHKAVSSALICSFATKRIWALGALCELIDPRAVSSSSRQHHDASPCSVFNYLVLVRATEIGARRHSSIAYQRRGGQRGGLQKSRSELKLGEIRA